MYIMEKACSGHTGGTPDCESDTGSFFLCGFRSIDFIFSNWAIVVCQIFSPVF